METEDATQQENTSLNFNYKNNFWQGYSILQSNYLKTRENFSQLFYIFQRLSVLYENHSKGLFQICNYYKPPNKIDSNTSFNKTFQLFIEYLKEEAINYKQLSVDTKEILSKDILVNIDNLEELFQINDTENINVKNTNTLPSSKMSLAHNKFKELETNCKEAFSICEKMKREFHNHLNLSLTEHIRKQDFNNKDFVHGNEPTILEKRQQYKNHLTQANNLINNYVKRFQDHADTYQKIDSSFIKTLMESLQKFSNKKKSNLETSFNLLNSKINNSISNIQILEDQKLFVKNYHSFGFPPQPLEFVNYSPDQKQFSDVLDLNKDNPLTKLAFQFLVDFAQSYNEILPKEQDIQDSFEKIISGNMTKEECDSLLASFDNSQEGQSKQIYFLSLLNNIRTKQCQMKEISFNCLLEIMIKIMHNTQSPLIDSNTKNRYWNWCTILSQTFYVNSEEKGKIFLSEEMQKQKIFDMIDWFNVLQFILNRDFKSTQNYTEYKFELAEEDKLIWKGIILTKIASILQNMMMLKPSEESIDNLIDKISDYFREDKATFISLKNEFSKELAKK